ncbi:MAG: tetratricopeptide repeat protein [Myxococcota bacterium]
MSSAQQRGGRIYRKRATLSIPPRPERPAPEASGSAAPVASSVTAPPTRLPEPSATPNSSVVLPFNAQETYAELPVRPAPVGAVGAAGSVGAATPEVAAPTISPLLDDEELQNLAALEELPLIDAPEADEADLLGLSSQPALQLRAETSARVSDAEGLTSALASASAQVGFSSEGLDGLAQGVLTDPSPDDDWQPLDDWLPGDIEEQLEASPDLPEDRLPEDRLPEDQAESLFRDHPVHLVAEADPLPSVTSLWEDDAPVSAASEPAHPLLLVLSDQAPELHGLPDPDLITEPLEPGFTALLQEEVLGATLEVPLPSAAAAVLDETPTLADWVAPLPVPQLMTEPVDALQQSAAVQAPLYALLEAWRTHDAYLLRARMREALAAHPHEGSLYACLAIFLLQVNAPDEARRVVLHGLQQAPACRILFDVLLELYVRQGMIEEARGLLRRLAQLPPRHPARMRSLVRQALQLGELSLASDLLEHARRFEHPLEGLEALELELMARKRLVHGVAMRTLEDLRISYLETPLALLHQQLEALVEPSDPVSRRGMVRSLQQLVSGLRTSLTTAPELR